MKRFSPALLILSGFLLGVTGSALSATVNGSVIFPDVPSGAYFDEAVGDMYSAGIITGYENGNFGPNDYVTRGQVAVMMKRFRDDLLGTSSSSSTRSSSSRSSSSSSSSSSASSVASSPNGAFRFAVTTMSVDENDDTATISIIRSGGNTGVVTVEYEAKAGTATAETDFEVISGKLTFDDGETSRTFDVKIKDDSASEGDETINLRIFSPTGGAVLSDADTAVLTIKDDDGSSSSNSSAGVSGKGAFEFSATEYVFGEDSGKAVITVMRNDGSDGSASVKYQAKDNTATGSHYDSVTGTLDFSSGETSKTFEITLHNNSDIGGNKWVDLILSEPTNGAVLGASKQARLTIDDDEIGSFGSGTLAFEEDSYYVSEIDKSVTVTIQRTGGTKGDITVEYETVDATAKNPSDYKSKSGTMTFKNGEAQKTITFEIVDDTDTEGEEYFNFKLQNPSNGVTISFPSTIPIYIQ